MEQELRRKLTINGEDYHLAVSQHGSGSPTASTLGKPGVLYLDTEASPERLYICTAANAEAGVYTWRPFEELLKITVSGDTTVVPGEDGITPHIGENGNWYLGNTDTGVKAAGTDGVDGGYYSPEITPNEADNSFTITFKPSKAGMAAVEPVAIKLPVGSGSGSGQNPTQGGLPASVKTILGNIMTILKAQVEDSTGTPQAYNIDVSSLFSDNDLLIEALGEDATVIGITATYTGGDVPVGTALTALTGITVTAAYSDGTSRAVTGYTLSGVIAEGDNTITISYSGYSVTITVTGVVVEQPDSGVTEMGSVLAIVSGVNVDEDGDTLIIT